MSGDWLCRNTSPKTPGAEYPKAEKEVTAESIIAPIDYLSTAVSGRLCSRLATDLFGVYQSHSAVEHVRKL